MRAKHLTLVSAFASGCLCSAVLLGAWSGDASGDRSRETRDDAVLADDGTRDAPLGELPAVAAPEPPSATSTSSSAQAAVNVGVRSATPEAGSSIADVLNRLEAAYQEGLGAAPSVSAPAGGVPAASASAPAETVEVAAATAVPAPAPHAPPVLVTAAPTPAPASTIERDTTPALVARHGTPEPGSSDGGPAVSTAVATNALEGFPTREDFDTARRVSQAELYQLQQLMLLQYVQLVVLPPATTTAAPQRARHTRGWPRTPYAIQPAPPWGRSGFSTSLSSPANPWGFQSQSAVLVR